MKVTRSQWILVAAACLIVASAAGQSGVERPPGVDENDWIPISATAGIVLTSVTGMPAASRLRDPDAEAAVSLRAGTGILMVKHAGSWMRVDLELPEPRVRPLH